MQRTAALLIFSVLPLACGDSSPSVPDASISADASPPTDSGTQSGPRFFSADSPWNTPIAADPTLRNDSAALVAHLRASSQDGGGLYINIARFSIPVYYASATSPMGSIFGEHSNAGEAHTFTLPIPDGAAPDPAEDGHMTIVSADGSQAWDAIGVTGTSPNFRSFLAATVDLRGAGIRPQEHTLGARWYEAHGARACGFPLVAGLILPSEIESGRIEHALALGYPGIRSSIYTHPASTAQVDTPNITETEGMPCGARVRLDPSLDVEALNLSPAALIIARALQEYGAYVADYAGAIVIYADGSPAAQRFWQGRLEGSEFFTEDAILDGLEVVAWGDEHHDAP